MGAKRLSIDHRSSLDILEKNVLVDFYYIDGQENFDRFFELYIPVVFETTYPILENLETQQTKNWWETKYASRLLEDQNIVRDIVNNFFEYNIILSENLDWLNKMKVYPTLRTSRGPYIGRKFVDLSEKPVELVYDMIHKLPLQKVYRNLFDEIVLMLQADKHGIRQCIQCGVIYKPTPRGREQRYCSDRCRKRYDRAKKNQEKLDDD